MPDKQEQREMSRRETMRVVREILGVYQQHEASGRITVDIQAGRAIWVKPVIADVHADGSIGAEDALKALEKRLAEFEAEGLSGCVHLIVWRGWPSQVEKVIELDKVRVG